VTGACVKELGRTNRKQRVQERVIKYWVNLFRTCWGSKEKKDNNWMSRIKEYLGECNE
jgi:hypothetical protein